MRSGLNEFDADFGFSVGVFVVKGDAAGLFFYGFGIFNDDNLTERGGEIQIDEGSMGADNDGMRAFGNVDIIGATSDDLNGTGEKYALAAATVGLGRKIRGERGHRPQLEGSYDAWGL
jgi:hypothetical protein